MDYEKGKKHWKHYREGYNNPGQWDQKKLLAQNDDITRAIISGITDRKADDFNGVSKFK